MTLSGEFQKTEIELYGKKESIQYYCIDLLWGQKLYQELRFVLVEMNGVQSILASTSLTLDPLSIIQLYSYRFRIECTFRELKQQIGAFCYHFWSKHMPKLNYYRKKEEPSPLECVEGEKSRKKNTGSCACHRNAYGIVLHCNGNPAEHFYLLYRKVRKHFFRLLGQSPELRITQIIQKQQNESGIYWDSLAS